MSTKIYDGTRYPMSVGAERYGRMFAAAVKPIRERLAAEATGRLLHAAVWSKLSGKPIWLDFELDDVVDAGTVELLGLEHDDDTKNLVDFITAADKVLEAAANSKRRMDPKFSLECSVSFVADPDGGEWGYAYAFASNDEIRAVWPALPGVEEYGYWNNSDGPDGISEDEWDERGRVWGRALGYDSFAEAGVQCQPPLPSPFVLYASRRRWFAAAAWHGFEAAERERAANHASARTDESRRFSAEFLTRIGKPTTVEEIAAQQDREDAEFVARFQ